MNPPEPSHTPTFQRVTTAVVITTAMLTFISSWRAAAVVLCDIASSAYYACGIAEQAIGKAAPWFVLGIMCFSVLVRLVFMESCSMFVRGGVYRTVRAAIGSPMAKLAMSALLFDYILTGPVSAVSAAQYLVHFLNESFAHLGYGYIHIPQWGVVLFACLIVMYFWRNNVIGIHESSSKSLRIVQLAGVMTVLLLGWSLLSLLLHPQPLPPLQPVLHEHALGWLGGFSWATAVPAIAIAIALGHSFLAMSGEEALSQVYREIEAPKIKNLRRAANIMVLFSFTLTGIISFLAVMIIPDEVRGQYADNLLSGLAMHVVGPTPVRLALQAFVVLVGVLILSGAVNTSMVGCNGNLNRLAEDGILPQWLRKPHHRYGTTSRTINAFAIAQIVICILSRGDVYVLGEAYAFGVIWSFVFQMIAVIVLRWRDHSPREFKVPLNIRVGRTDFPLGIILIGCLLFTIAVANFFTKTTATIFGSIFTVTCFIFLIVAERWQQRRAGAATAHLERVNYAYQATIDPTSVGLRHERRILCAVRDPRNLTHLRKVLEKIDGNTTDLIVIAIKLTTILPGKEVEELPVEEQLLITNVVALAEKYGVHVTPIILPANDPIYAICKAALDLGANEIVVGRSGKTRPEIQLEKLSVAWGYVSAAAARRMLLRVIWPQQELRYEIQ